MEKKELMPTKGDIMAVCPTAADLFTWMCKWSETAGENPSEEAIADCVAKRNASQEAIRDLWEGIRRIKDAAAMAEKFVKQMMSVGAEEDLPGCAKFGKKSFAYEITDVPRVIRSMVLDEALPEDRIYQCIKPTVKQLCDAIGWNEERFLSAYGDYIARKPKARVLFIK